MLSLVLALSLTGQCPGGVCPPVRSTVQPAYRIAVRQAVQPVVRAVPVHPVRQAKRHGLFGIFRNVRSTKCSGGSCGK